MREDGAEVLPGQGVDGAEGSQVSGDATQAYCQHHGQGGETVLGQCREGRQCVVLSNNVT